MDPAVSPGNPPGHVPVEVTLNRRDSMNRLLIGRYVGCSGCFTLDDQGIKVKRPWDEAEDANHEPDPRVAT
jgi:hypothetical protein